MRFREEEACAPPATKHVHAEPTSAADETEPRLFRDVLFSPSALNLERLGAANGIILCGREAAPSSDNVFIVAEWLSVDTEDRR